MLVGDLDEVTQIVNNLTIGPAGTVQKTRSGSECRSRVATAGNPARQAAQRPMPRGVPLGMATGGGAAAAAYYQQATGRRRPSLEKCRGQMGGPGGVADRVGPGKSRWSGWRGGRTGGGRPLPAYVPGPNGSPPPAAYDQPYMPNYAWPSYAAYPNYAAVTYPKQYSARPGLTSARSIPIRKCRSAGARCRWNGMTAGGSSTSTIAVATNGLPPGGLPEPAMLAAESEQRRDCKTIASLADRTVRSAGLFCFRSCGESETIGAAARGLPDGRRDDLGRFFPKIGNTCKFVTV